MKHDSTSYHPSSQTRGRNAQQSYIMFESIVFQRGKESTQQFEFLPDDSNVRCYKTLKASRAIRINVRVKPKSLPTLQARRSQSQQYIRLDHRCLLLSFTILG